MTVDELVKELTRSFEKSKCAASKRPWAHPAPLPPHPDTHSDRHPDDPTGPMEFKEYF